MRLVFWERFDDPALPRWSVRGTEHREDSELARGSMNAVKVHNSEVVLRIIPDWVNPGHYLTGHIGTEESFQFTYGKVTARAKFPPFHGGHAAIWLQTPRPTYTVGRPEIDIGECFGAHNPDRKSGVVMFHNVYYRDTDEGPVEVARLKTGSVSFGTWHREYHDYTCIWTPDAYAFEIDGRPVGRITQGLGDTPKYLVLSQLARDYEVADIAHHPLSSYDLRVKWLKVWQ